MSRAYDAVVVGAGPAGLSAAAEITRGGGRCLVVEQGPAHTARDRHAASDVLSGVGGAGLFSDGKHSFFPSATEIWRLPDRTALGRAYEETRALLGRHGVEAPSFPVPRDGDHRTTEHEEGAWQLKRYPSIYASLDERMRIIRELYEEAGELPWLSARVIAARRTDAGIELRARQNDDERTIETRAVVIATGRLSPRWIRSWLEPLDVRFAFRRLEIGVRLETSAGASLFDTTLGVDPKLTFDEDDGTKLLTFCTCRDGEVVLGSICNIHAVSGRADGPRTGRSNVGLLARITDASLARAIEARIFASTAPFTASLSEILRGPASDPRMQRTFGDEGARVLARALERFVERSPELADDERALLHAPCIEGVGDYPISEPDLALAPGVFVAGDASGRFRGIVASMISGRYVGLRMRR